MMNRLYRDHWDEIIAVLARNRFRSFLTAFGVFWGIFILMVLLSATRGLENGVKQSFSNLASNTIFIWSNATTKPYKGMAAGRSYQFNITDLALLKKIGGLKYVSPRNHLTSTEGIDNVRRGSFSGFYAVNGDYPEYILQKPMKIAAGRFLNYNDINAKRKVVVIGQRVVEELYPARTQIINSYIKIHGIDFQVVGVYNSSFNSGEDMEVQNKQMHIPFTTFREAFHYSERIDSFVITAREKAISGFKGPIFEILKKRHVIDPNDSAAIGFYDLYEEYNKINGLFQILRVVSFVVGLLILLSGLIGITNILLIVVKERMNEIGIRRAIGATPAMIVKQILAESVVLTFFSGISGVIAGTAVIYFANNNLPAYIGNDFMFSNPGISPGLVLGVLLLLVTTGIVAGLIPAATALKTKPIHALKS